VLFGRDAERARIGVLLDGARASRSGVLIVRGEPGIGKTALLEDARDRAADMEVLAARGVESEAELPFAGLHQLLRPALPLAEHLPGPQAVALRSALGLAGRGGDDRFLISLAVLTLLAELAERRPVLCLIDDAQWLDAPSRDALLFVARRLDAEGIVLVFAVREDDARSFEARELPSVFLGGLVDEAAAALLGRDIPGSAAPAVRESLLAQAGGNALALVELPGALTAAQLVGEEPLPERLPVSHALQRTFLERVRRLPEPTQRLLAIAAADDSGELRSVMCAAEALGIDAEALAPAEDARLLSVRGTSVRFRHPLVRSAVYGAAPLTQRHAAHLALANALTDDQQSDQRAWHRAAASLGPDADVAADLERTAERARDRSGHAAAAAALERAAELSSDSESRARRFVLAARAAWNAGQPERSAALCDRADPILTDERRRADIDHLRGVIGWRCGSLPEAAATLIDGAARIAPSDSRKALMMLADGAMAAWDAGDYPRLVNIGEATAALPRSFESDCDDVEAEEFGLLADVLVGCVALGQGTTSSDDRLTDVLVRACDGHEPRLLMWAAIAAEVAGHDELESELLRRAATLARASGAVDRLAMALEARGVQGFLAGEFRLAAEAADEGLTLAQETGLPNAANLHRASLAWLAAVQGRDDECRSHAAELIEAARRTSDANAASIAEWALSLLDLGSGRPEEAAARLAALSTAPLGVGHPFFVLTSAPDLVEAYVRSGREEEARAAFAVLERFAQPGAPHWALGVAARCRGVLAEDAAEAEREFAEALRIHSESKRPFDSARTELLFGEHLRRQRRRVEAREYLRSALAGFESLGAAPWAERARAELRASGETARKRDPSTASQLTPQELQIARMVAEGRSNKEVAAQLFLSPRTIDSHLRNVFSKLGLTSRTQLARLSLVEDLSQASAVPA
jgi:DNA-binding CsgD family transcriptional regulator